MAKRYSGNLQISVVYDDKNHYRTAVSSGGKLLWRGIVNPAPAGFGRGVAYDSPQAYDEVASSALAFADVALEAKIRTGTDKPTGDIYAEDVAGLTELNANSAGISS